MKNYSSKSSLSVKLITIGIVIVMGIVVLSIFTINEKYGKISGIIISLIILSTLIYFFANSLKEIIIGEKNLTLEKNIGKIEIPFSDIIKIEKLDFSNLSMTYGSKGVFGYIGNTMDDSISMVNDRKNMLRIITNEKKYTFSSDNREELISEIKNVLQHRV
ncbi:PH domain-containing protein [Aequorivita lipolytica]|jgi:hypothetical protein|uniref:Bacterial Pleckstrin homology domain-containing protein n=1 Tax=Aequorivita lipolytica TaxID=153267 RepID=A0A5C6YKE8_9FLAO|nr:PH domain-containing protein [Aequorivita lipolytica]TXD67808.1 hypothetical protein ESV24_14955 [Aequorivita lipolytica]SRX54157.1 hypothetical protein AEQU2_03061 [Aequorivita lipolytica]